MPAPTHTTTVTTVTDVPDHQVLHHALPAIVVHTALRREFRLAAPLVRDVIVTDTHRIEVVTRHLDLLLRLLHHHHELEDDLVWPILRERADEALQPVVDQMEEQHIEIARLADEAAVLLTDLDTTAEIADRDRLADVLDDLHLHLVEHLDLEERLVLPLAERHVHATEWEEIGRHADEATPKNERALTFGMLQYEGDPDVLASMLEPAPRLVRLLVPRLAHRAFRRHAIAVHGTPTP